MGPKVELESRSYTKNFSLGCFKYMFINKVFELGEKSLAEGFTL